MNPQILIVDDEPDIRELLELTLMRMGLNCLCAAGLQEAVQALKKETFQLCLTDMKLGDGTGLELIEFIQNHSPQTPVAMITAFSNMETAIDALKAGAFDYVAKPIDLPKLRALINAALKISQQADHDAGNRLLGKSQSIQALRTRIDKLARSLAPVFIHGESGSGKELAARMMHQQSARASGPFIAVNCGAIPSELMESEFFGHEKGSFTGALDKKVGLFKAAEGGTLFLDEVADLPKDMQVKLLRAIQEKSIRPIGSTQEIPVDIRLLSATHKNLSDEVANGSFRQDLFYRINVIELTIPSLRERPDDIQELSEYFLRKLSERYEAPLASLDTKALEKLKQYAFPGNVRELENILERAFTLSDGLHINAEDLQLACKTHLITANTDGQWPLEPAIGRLESFIDEVEQSLLTQALERTHWNKTAAAELLGVSFRTMRYKLKKFDIG